MMTDVELVEACRLVGLPDPWVRYEGKTRSVGCGEGGDTLAVDFPKMQEITPMEAGLIVAELLRAYRAKIN